MHPRFKAVQRPIEGLHWFPGLRLVVNLEARDRESPDEFRQRFAGAIHEAFMRASRSNRINRQHHEEIMRAIAGRVLPIQGRS